MADEKSSKSLFHIVKTVDCIETETFIEEIKNRPSIWNANFENYNNKQTKLADWKSLSTCFIPDFAEKTWAERNKISEHCFQQFRCSRLFFFYIRFEVKRGKRLSLS